MNLKNDGDLIKALGYLVLYASYVEEAIDNCIDVFTQYYPLLSKELSKQTTKQKIKFIQSYFDGNPPSEELVRTQFLNLLKYVIRLFEGRNEIIHGHIYGNMRLGEFDKLTSNRKNDEERAITAGEIYDLANAFFSTLEGLNQASLHSLHRYFKQVQ